MNNPHLVGMAIAFTALPTELRHHIYTLLLVPSTAQTMTEPQWRLIAPGLPLVLPIAALVLCRQIYHELLPYLYSHNNPYTLSLPHPATSIAQPPARPLISNFRICLTMRMTAPIRSPNYTVDGSRTLILKGADELKLLIERLAMGPVQSLKLLVYIYYRPNRPVREGLRDIPKTVPGLCEIFRALESKLEHGGLSIERWRPLPDPAARMARCPGELKEWLALDESDPVEFTKLRAMLQRSAVNF